MYVTLKDVFKGHKNRDIYSVLSAFTFNANSENFSKHCGKSRLNWPHIDWQEGVSMEC